MKPCFVQFVAPVTVGKGAVIAAGATITADVPPDTLAIARVQQINRPGWASRQRALLAAGGSRQAASGKGQGGKPPVSRPAPLAKKDARTRKGRK